MYHPTDKIVHTMAFGYTSHGALDGMRNSSMSPPCVTDPTTNCTRHSTMELHLAPIVGLGLIHISQSLFFLYMELFPMLINY